MLRRGLRAAAFAGRALGSLLRCCRPAPPLRAEPASRCSDAVFPATVLQSVLQVSQRAALHIVVRRPHVAKLGRGVLAAKLDAFAAAAGCGERDAAAQMAARPHYLVLGVERLRATRDVEARLAHAHAPWQHQLFGGPLAARCQRMYLPLARRARLRLLLDHGLASANATPPNALLRMTERTFKSAYNPVVSRATRGRLVNPLRIARDLAADLGHEGPWAHSEFGAQGGAAAAAGKEDAAVSALLRANLLLHEDLPEYWRAQRVFQQYQERSAFCEAYPEHAHLLRRARGGSDP
eukprot:366496-Chlamydomonas_euryale.AAC.24